jgi:hypothetical protein
VLVIAICFHPFIAAIIFILLRGRHHDAACKVLGLGGDSRRALLFQFF